MKIILWFGLCFTFTQVNAEVVSSNADHFALRHQAESALTPEQLWQRLVKPNEWWHPDHTYSGNSANLSLSPQAGGHWREDWSGNSVLHGTVLNAQPNTLLRLDAPFGPLQGMAITAVWTISIKPYRTGSMVTFDEVVSGTSVSGLDKLADAVDSVKGEALRRLVVLPD